MNNIYPIGTPGEPWQQHHKEMWFSSQVSHRSYFNEVVSKIDELTENFDKVQYGTLDYAQRFPLFILKSKVWDNTKPNVLITGGVHGYETSGVHGALDFLARFGKEYEAKFNLIVAPCISPWGYETINRWNPNAIDPNRSFYSNSPAPEAASFIKYLADSELSFLMHIDLHETTDTDNSEFRPALAARDGKVNHNWNIPDGFYLVGHTQKPQPEFQKAIIEEVQKVTTIAPADSNNELIGVALEQFGVINYDGTKLGLCMGVTNAPYVTTTEVYPDGELSTPENCIAGQVAAIVGALNYVGQLNREVQ
ncbi:M14 family metallopeptidase [Pseudoalteromonas xiamenensis]|uniref:M14 family metallocarboxypeptidase n=1 Tax=Pseudoalteromonas xiamenensis TaxID=882626 RepID=A0A975DEE5_9GAMM|nr:M14 family metallocarboxypeptidase [Pseudoalteromonas xiamenensis]QTH70110.1 M14 family metallocarboxypeptidase [Pseudoalteromonas xiamenensis]QTH71440.1 M14 family metallocarboxypeptidase [Pseudoalteromonas xiamenensis]